MDWDKYFMSVAREVSKQSKCLSRQIGAVIVKDKSIISTGYNGPPRGVPHCDSESRLKWFRARFPDKTFQKGVCPRRSLGFKSGEGTEYCIAGHAERNAIVNASRMGVSVKGATLYCYCGIPCKDCTIEIINAGIARVVCVRKKPLFYDDVSLWLFLHSDVKLDVLEDF